VESLRAARAEPLDRTSSSASTAPSSLATRLRTPGLARHRGQAISARRHSTKIRTVRPSRSGLAVLAEPVEAVDLADLLADLLLALAGRCRERRSLAAYPTGRSGTTELRSGALEIRFDPGADARRDAPPRE
jgi:hypothetical protein